MSNSPQDKTGLPSTWITSGVLRQHEDEAALERAWRRLQNAEPRPAPLLRFARGGLQVVALLGLGFWLGRSSAPPSQELTGVAELRSEERALPAAGAQLPVAGPSESAEVSAESAPARVQPQRATQRRAVRGVVARRSAPALAEEPGEAAEPVSSGGRARWLVLAERGDFAGAFAEVDHEGGFDRALQTSTPEELMTLADVARFAGRSGRAIQVLREVTTRHEQDPNAPIAAMMLGNLLSQAGDAAGAARAYALNRRLSPGGDFAEDALVREFAIARTARDLFRMETLVAQYESEYAGGQHLEEMRSEAQELRQQLAEEQLRPVLPGDVPEAEGEQTESDEPVDSE